MIPVLSPLLKHRRNLMPIPNPATSTDYSTRANITWNNGAYVGNNSVLRTLYETFSFTGGVAYNLSVSIKTDDGNAPVVSAVSTSGDLSLVIAGDRANSKISVVALGDGIYKASAVYVTPSTPSSSNVGLVKYTTQSAKGFTVVGNWKLVRK